MSKVVVCANWVVCATPTGSSCGIATQTGPSYPPNSSTQFTPQRTIPFSLTKKKRPATKMSEKKGKELETSAPSDDD